MNNEDHTNPPTPPALWSELIDGTDQNMPTDEPTPQEIDHVADQQLMHALLQHWFGDRDAVNNNIASTAEQLQYDEQTKPLLAGRIGSRLYLLSSSIAAAFLIVCGVWFLSNSSQPAIATVEAAIKADQQLLDRSYVITMEHAMPHPAGPVTTVHLDLRGNMYVARFINHRGHPVVIGNNGEQSWIVRPDGQAILQDHGRGLQDLLIKDSDISIPFLTVENVLNRLGDNYDLSLISSQRLSTDDRVSWQHLIGNRTSGSGPDRIEMWSHPDTGVAQKFTLQWSDSAKPGHPQKIVFQRIDASPQEDVYYEPGSHTHEGSDRNPRRWRGPDRGHRNPTDRRPHLMDRDENGDGALSLEELGPNGARLIQRFDINKDGILDESEINKMPTPRPGDGEIAIPPTNVDAAGFINPFYSMGLDWTALTAAGPVEFVLPQPRSEWASTQIKSRHKCMHQCSRRWAKGINCDKYDYLGEFDLQ
ncbi:MAG: hypothetical protein P8J86_09015 [Phycisphaerales bacterium]|nr:hypothetical protein [Phycisphaerales bacterium]